MIDEDMLIAEVKTALRRPVIATATTTGTEVFVVVITELIHELAAVRRDLNALRDEAGL